MTICFGQKNCSVLTFIFNYQSGLRGENTRYCGRKRWLKINRLYEHGVTVII